MEPGHRESCVPIPVHHEAQAIHDVSNTTPYSQCDSNEIVPPVALIHSKKPRKTSAGISR